MRFYKPKWYPWKFSESFIYQVKNDSDYNIAIFTSSIIFLLWLGEITLVILLGLLLIWCFLPPVILCDPSISYQSPIAEFGDISILINQNFWTVYILVRKNWKECFLLMFNFWEYCSLGWLMENFPIEIFHIRHL